MVKDKPNSIRTYDEDGFRKRAACLCVRNELEDEVSFEKKFLSLDGFTKSPQKIKHTNIVVNWIDFTRYIEWEQRQMDCAWWRPGAK
jgi:hypothetical protein